MRWRRLFDDLEAQFDAARAADMAGEVAERTRREIALLQLVDRLRAAEGAAVVLSLPAAGVLRGRLLEAGSDWLLVEEGGGREVLVPLAAVLGVTGLGPRSAAPDDGPVAKRLDLRWALRGLARSRAGVAVGLVDGTLVTGTLDRVGADHLDLAEHGLGEARRAGAVRQVRVVPLTAVALVRSG
ncbi:hypothetical protein BH24ACT10_BH24ACT10_13340 [soil metagenome]